MGEKLVFQMGFSVFGFPGDFFYYMGTQIIKKIIPSAWIILFNIIFIIIPGPAEGGNETLFQYNSIILLISFIFGVAQNKMKYLL